MNQLSFREWLYSELVSMGGVGMTKAMDMEDMARMNGGAFPDGISATAPKPPFTPKPLTASTTIRRNIKSFTGSSVARLMSKPPMTSRPSPL